MTYHFVTGQDDKLLPWAAKQIATIMRPEKFGKAVALGVATGPTPTDQLMVVAVYHSYSPDSRSCQISIAAADPRWTQRGIVADILRVPFYQYDCYRVGLAIPHKATRVIRLAKALGFTQEGVIRAGFGPGLHLVVCGMLRPEFDRRYRNHGLIVEQGRLVTAAAARSDEGSEGADRLQSDDRDRAGSAKPH